MLLKNLVILSILSLISPVQEQAEIFICEQGKIAFVSNANLETIKATSDELKGVLDLRKMEFAFKVKVNSFQGFNSPLQREHFFENFMEAVRYPEARYTGRIINLPNDWKKLKSFVCRTKGILLIHGIEVERIIDVSFRSRGEYLEFSAGFVVPLNDHEISIPKIVGQKISKEIGVQVDGKLKI